MLHTSTVLLSTPESDSHTWNLVYLQLYLEELGLTVRNLGPCTPHRTTVNAIKLYRPDCVVLSSVNGHGFTQGRTLIQLIREETGDVRLPIVIGGKLSTAEVDESCVRRELLAAGFDEVFHGSESIAEFRVWLLELFCTSDSACIRGKGGEICAKARAIG
jgi:methylaspartate mutase sigma subunit